MNIHRLHGRNVASRHVPTALCLVAALSAPSLGAQTGAGEHAGEFWVDGGALVQPGSDPSFPDAAIDHAGRALYVWKTNISGQSNDIYLRRFATDLSPLSDPVQVNTFTDGNQTYPRLAVSPDDSFLVIWQSAEPDPNVEVNRMWIRSQAFDAAGAPAGDELLVSTYSTGEATDVHADAAALTGGGYVVVWRSRPPDGNTGGGGLSILGRRIGSNGAALADPFVVNSTAGVTEHYPAVTELSDGGFLVVWTVVNDVFGRRFMADATPVGDDFKIDTFDMGSVFNPDAVLHGDGRVLVVWEDTAPGNIDQIRGRVFSSNLVAMGNDFQLNDLATGTQIEPRAGDYGTNGFFVVWEATISAGADDNDRTIQGRIVTGANQFLGGQFQVNDWETDAQQFPGIGGRDDRVAIGWHSKSNPDTTSNVINGQIWSVCGIFCDGFEGTDE